MTIDSKGRNVTSVLEDDVDLELTGKITRDSDQFYSIEWSNGAYGGFLVEEGNEHIAYLDDYYSRRGPPSCRPTFYLMSKAPG